MRALLDISFQRRTQLDDFADPRESDLARGLHILGLMDENAPGSFNSAPLKNKSAQYSSLNPWIKTMLFSSNA